MNEEMPKSIKQLVAAKQLPRIILKWIIIVCGLSVLVINIVLLGEGMETIIRNERFDRNPDNPIIYRLAKVLFVVLILVINAVLALGMVGARSKNFWMSLIFTVILSLILVLHIMGYVFKLKIQITEKLIFDLFENQYYSVWVLIFHSVYNLVAIIHTFILWKEMKKIRLKNILNQQTSSV